MDEGHEAVELAALAPTPEPELSLKLEDIEPATVAAVEVTETAEPAVSPPEFVPEPQVDYKAEITPPVAQPSRTAPTSRTLHPRQQSRRRGPDGPPPLFEGQGVTVGSTQPSSSGSSGSEGSSESQTTRSAPSSSAATFHGLPTENGAIQRYLTHRYKGVGEKTAEQVVEAFGSEVFSVMDSQPERVAKVLSEHRAEALLAAWQADKARRSEATGSAST